MTAFSGIYSSLTGLLGFTNGLDVVSNNISNLNTPGYKGNEPLFEDLGQLGTGTGSGDASFEDAVGQGVKVDGQVQDFSEGQIQATGNPTDVAINGNGFFVLDDKNQQVYTRAGQFSFDSTGHLVNSSGAYVQAIDGSGQLSNLVVDESQRYASSATTKVSFNQTLSTGQTTTDTVGSISVVDADGTTQSLSAALTQDTTATIPGSSNNWDVTVTDGSGQTVGTGVIGFDGTGNPIAGSNTIDVTLTAADGASTPVTFDFTDATSFSEGTTSNLQVESSDGVPPGSLTGVTFDQNGTVQLSFSNGKTLSGQQLAIANFPDPSRLADAGNASYAIPEGSTLQPALGQPGETGFGSIQPGSVELANVDLGREFASIIVLQQGYQGSSQVLNVSSQLLDTLYKSIS